MMRSLSGYNYQMGRFCIWELIWKGPRTVKHSCSRQWKISGAKILSLKQVGREGWRDRLGPNNGCLDFIVRMKGS